MDSVRVGRKHESTRLVTIGWLGLPAVVIGYVVLRHLLDSSAAFVASQLLFLTPLACAVVALAVAGVSSRRGSRARITWGLFAAATLCILVAESALSMQEAGFVGSRLGVALFDVGNAAAMVLLFMGSGVAAALDRMGWRRSLRSVLDGVGLLTLAFGVLYALVGEHHIGEAGDAGHALRLTAYALIGFALLGAGGLVFGNAYALRAPWNRVLATAIAVLALAVVYWAVTDFGGVQSGQDSVEMLSAVLYVIGYYLLLMAGVHRLAHSGRVWASAPSVRLPAAWPGVAISTLIFGSVVWLVTRAAGALPGSQSSIVYTSALAVASVSMVARTALATAESVGLDSLSLTDPVTGVMGPRVFSRAWESAVAEAARAGGVVGVYSVDVDDFALFNAERGFAAGDRCLVTVARALERAAGPGAWIVRFSGDEFCVMVAAAGRGPAQALGRSLCSAVRDAKHAPAVTASVGMAIYPDDGSGSEDLVHHAAAARVWAQRQGKNRFAAYDARIGEAVSVDERLATAEGAGLELVRALVTAADARDPESHDHARNVAALSHLLASDLGLDSEHVARIEVAAILHDIGKIALPNVMLGGKTLSAKEQTVAREHVVLGERLLESLTGTGVPSWVRAHHERWDGAGYPDGLAGESIPLEARIIALADSYDGMIAGRRYGAPMSKAAALQEIDLGMGTRFDPVVAERFIAMVGTTVSLGWSDEWTEA